MKEKIKEVILEVAEKYGIKVDKIILFGSRARGDYRDDSDWDILIVSKTEVDRNTEDEFRLEVEDKLVKAGIIPEIIVTSKGNYVKFNRPAYVYYYANKEGVVL